MDDLFMVPASNAETYRNRTLFRTRTVIKAVVGTVELIVAGVAAGVEAVLLRVQRGEPGAARDGQALPGRAQHDEPAAPVVQSAGVG